MEVLNRHVAFLSNYEVYALLKQEKASKLLAKKKAGATNANATAAAAAAAAATQIADASVDKHLPTIVYESLRYLDKTPCAHQSPHVVAAFMRACDERQSEFKLTKVEKLQLLNLRPSSAAELQCIIEDTEGRFTQEQMDDLLDFVLNALPDHETNHNTATSDLEANNNK